MSDERADEFLNCLGNGQPEYFYDIDEEEEEKSKKLKTLNELTEDYDCNFEDYIVFKKEIEEAAINWMKKLQKAVNDSSLFCTKCNNYSKFTANCDCTLDKVFYNCIEESEAEGAIKFIKLFFNISEEEEK